jgi:hypothetical protein
MVVGHSSADLTPLKKTDKYEPGQLDEHRRFAVIKVIYFLPYLVASYLCSSKCNTLFSVILESEMPFIFSHVCARAHVCVNYLNVIFHRQIA